MLGDGEVAAERGRTHNLGAAPDRACDLIQGEKLSRGEGVDAGEDPDQPVCDDRCRGHDLVAVVLVLHAQPVCPLNRTGVQVCCRDNGGLIVAGRGEDPGAAVEGDGLRAVGQRTDVPACCGVQYQGLRRVKVAGDVEPAVMHRRCGGPRARPVRAGVASRFHVLPDRLSCCGGESLYQTLSVVNDPTRFDKRGFTGCARACYEPINARGCIQSVITAHDHSGAEHGSVFAHVRASPQQCADVQVECVQDHLAGFGVVVGEIDPRSVDLRHVGEVVLMAPQQLSGACFVG
ncbi:hypothetical protein SRABI128_05817 [Microbacterium sp. Bi128]|nr:hypothetical protein SRABI128_05817 [Microbacterium sp. Bi128]